MAEKKQMKQDKPRGRPVTLKAHFQVTQRLSEETLGQLEGLAAHWQVNRTEAFRRAVDIAHKATLKG